MDHMITLDPFMMILERLLGNTLVNKRDSVRFCALCPGVVHKHLGVVFCFFLDCLTHHIAQSNLLICIFL